ncbi:MAG: hypothetical protein HZB71_08195 [Betaproteobacteria bacterium]|nr:hypothetical protein [Betaproteobacteria bacterium]
MSRKTWEELAWQLTRLPGGAAAALPDFFGALLDGEAEERRWPLREGGCVERLPNEELRVGGTPLATLPPELLEVARETGLSPILLGLLGVAAGDLEGDRRLKAVHPRLDGAAKDLMLMTVCRLCG